VLDNSILKCADPKCLQTICNNLSAAKIDALLRKWLQLLPHPFTGADRKAGYRYDISILQAEFSATQVLDRLAHRRLFFEQVIRENLGLGRPEEITTINNTYDFGVGKRLHNVPRLRENGFAANRGLVERMSHDCILGEDTFQAINRPVAAGRQRASGLRFADQRVHALLHALILFSSPLRDSARPICASISPSCQGAIQRRSPRVPSPTSCIDCACTASLSACPTASAIALPTSASASPCSSREPAIACCAPVWPQKHG
jgi:hypothetical protein